MSIDVKMTYTENPYVDIIVYNTKLLAKDAILKMQQQADAHETVESLKHADMLIMCKEGTITFELFDEFSEKSLRAIGLTGMALINAMTDKDTIPQEKRPQLIKIASKEFIEEYEDMNAYYRMLSGKESLEVLEEYESTGLRVNDIIDWMPPDGVSIDLSVPISKMTNEAIMILKANGVLDEIYEVDHSKFAYVKYLDRKIDPYTARKARGFDTLYIPSINSEEIEKEFKDRLEINRDYTIKAIYSDAYKYDSDYYDNVMAVFIVLNAMIDVISRIQEFIARKEVFDLRTVKYIFESYGVDYFPEIPLRYQIALVKNLHTLLKYKSTTRCMVEICSIFGMKNIEIFKYYMLRIHNKDKATGEYMFTGNVEEDFDLKFVKIPIDESMDDYIRDPAYYADYDEIVTGDATWNGGLEHEAVKKIHLSQEFNYSRTKYLSIDSLYDIAKMSAQQSYFFNMLYDNVELEELIKVNIPAISSERGFKIADVFTFLTSLTHYYYGNKDLIMDTPSKVLYVNGFNFKADLEAIAETLHELRFDREAQELLEKFNIPEDSIPTFKQLMNIFVNNLEIRDLVIKGMKNADSLKHYLPYRKLYDSLMITELTFDHFKSPDGDYYRDEDGDATYTAYLQAEDPILYYKLVEIKLIDDDDIRKSQITNLIDNIVYILEEYIDSEKFNYIFHFLPAVSIDAIKQFINSVINFYKSYKAHILGINTIYYFDDPYDGYIQLIDDLLLNRWFEKDDIISIIDRIEEFCSKMTKKEKINFIDRVFLDISTWKYRDIKDYITIRDGWDEIFTILNKDDSLEFNDEISAIATRYFIESSITPLDTIGSNSYYKRFDSVDVTDRCWLYQFNN